ncbi:MAG TPA: hypothetical protein VIX86_16960 [Streptosporangiaceae bacterium]
MREETATRTRSGHMIALLRGLREPVVVILLLIAYFTAASGKPLDGLLMAIAAVCLAWDAGHRLRQAGQSGIDLDQAYADPGAEGPATSAAPPLSRRRRATVATAWLTAAVSYVLVVGSFIRYSWPATAAVLGLGSVVVVTGWRGPRRPRPRPVKPSRAGVLLWLAVILAGCLWELQALLQQPTLLASSYPHPTISTLTDPVLAGWAGRSALLAVWLLFGWFLVER